MDDRETQGDLVMVSQRASRNKDSRDAPSWPKVYSGSARILMNFLIYKTFGLDTERNMFEWFSFGVVDSDNRSINKCNICPNCTF